MSERKREREREKERQRERKPERQKDQISARGRIFATNVTAVTAPKPGLTSARLALEEKRGKERARETERERKREI